MEGIYYWIEKWAELRPDKAAILTDDESLSYAKLKDSIDRYVTFLLEEKGVKPGDRIAVLSHNRHEIIILLFAIAKIQAIAVPLNVRLNPHELEYQLRDSGATLIFVEAEFAAHAEHFRTIEGLEIESFAALEQLPQAKPYFNEIDENASFIICYTSGTTGKPKGAVLTQKNMFYNALNNVLTLDITSKDRSIVLLPLFHIGGIGLFALPTLYVGGTIIIGGKFEPDKALQLAEKHRATLVFAVPSMHQLMLDSPYFDKLDLSSVRCFYSGGAPCPKELINAFYEKGFVFGQGFGLTETSPTVFLLTLEDAPRKIGSVGKPAFYNEVKLVDDEDREVPVGEIGHLIVKGGNVMKGYWNNEKATNEALKDGWFYTGDLAKRDEEGFYYIAGRKKEMIISGGENIYPLEIENVINELPDVKEAAVIGIPDERWGEVPIAFVAKRENSPLAETEIIEYCKKYLAKYKVPKEVHFMAELPKNSTGKIAKNQLSQLINK